VKQQFSLNNNLKNSKLVTRSFGGPRLPSGKSATLLGLFVFLGGVFGVFGVWGQSCYAVLRFFRGFVFRFVDSNTPTTDEILAQYRRFVVSSFSLFSSSCLGILAQTPSISLAFGLCTLARHRRILAQHRRFVVEYSLIAVKHSLVSPSNPRSSPSFRCQSRKERKPCIWTTTLACANIAVVSVANG